ncbi:MAG: 4-(cytidine 5'-diphospho)-2-C-methyl-D-erythritol kinase [Planctomycetota bacterium]
MTDDRPASLRAGVICAQAPAKVNLVLDVLGPRGDGFHEIGSLAMGVGLYDRICCRPMVGDAPIVECSDRSLNGPANIAYRAARKLAERLGVPAGVRIGIEKQIPAAAGLGGGSSDAAATLRLCEHAWRARPDPDTLIEVAAECGSDVPLFFHLPVVRVGGRGERVQSSGLRWRGWAVLVWPGIPISTADVYRAWQREDRRPDTGDRIAAAEECATARELTSTVRNGLEDASFRVCAGLVDMREGLSCLGFGPFHVSGSGSMMFALFDDPDTAWAAVRGVEQSFKGVRVFVAAAPVGQGPITIEE